MSTPPPIQNASPFTPEQMVQMADARKAMKPIRRAISMAQMDGWTLAIFAGLTVICGISSVTALLVGAALGVIAYIELSNIPRLRQLDPTVAKTLGINQLALAGVLIVYAAFNLLHPSPALQNALGKSAELKNAGLDPSMFKEFDSLGSLLNQLVYGSLLVIAFGVQGSTALFYFRRKKMIETYLALTPDWLLQMQKSGFNP